MSEYWVSNKKKYCEVCKMWYADNKVSVENHERGQKHKAMIQQHLREMSKRAKERDAEQGHLNATLIAMEQAALASMRRDGKSVPSSSLAPTVSTSAVSPAPTVPTIDPKIAEQHAIIQKQIDDRKRKVQEQEEKKKKSQRTVLSEDSIFKKRKYEHEGEFRKKVETKRHWDVRKLAVPDVVEAPVFIPIPSGSSESIKKEPEPIVEKHVAGLGPWIPIVKEAPSTIELQMMDEKKIVLDDLPEQESAKKVDPLFDEDEIEAEEVAFKTKVLPVTTSSAKSKPVFFRKTKKGGSKDAKIKEEN